MSKTLAQLWLSALVGALACARAGPSEPTQVAKAARTEAALEAARAFQLAYDADLREDPRSFLTTVAAHYLGPGERLGLRADAGAWVPVDDGDDATIEFEVRAEGLAVRRGDERTVLSEAGALPADDGRVSFGVSHQGEDWRVLIHDLEAPLRASFPGVAWFPLDAAKIVDARFEPEPTRAPKSLQTSRGTTKTLYLAGRLHFTLDGQALELQAFAYGPAAEPGEPWLVPFRDATSGHQSYAAGRYLELSAPASGVFVSLDFNRATNPLCAYSEHYNCPVPPRFNRLELAIEAGAMAPDGH